MSDEKVISKEDGLYSFEMKESLRYIGERLSEDNYQTVNLAKLTEESVKHLMALYANGDKETVEKLLPDFEKKYGNKISVKGDNISMKENDCQQLRQDIVQNFENFYPNFIAKSKSNYKYRFLSSMRNYTNLEKDTVEPFDFDKYRSEISENSIALDKSIYENKAAELNEKYQQKQREEELVRQKYMEAKKKEAEQYAPYMKTATTKEEEEKDFNQLNTVDDWIITEEKELSFEEAGNLIVNDYEEIASRPVSYIRHVNPTEQLSLKDYQEVCAKDITQNIAYKLVALHALGKDDEAEKILPGFKKNFSDKIEVTRHISTIAGEDLKALDDAIIKNFNKIYPDFSKDTENVWRQKHDFQKPEIQMKDNQFINLTENIRYDVENVANQIEAYKFRKKYADIVEQAKNKVQENAQVETNNAERSNTESGVKRQMKTASVKRKQNVQKPQKSAQPVKEQMKNAAQQRQNQKRVAALRQENVAKNDNIPNRKQITPVIDAVNNKAHNLAEILKRKLISSRTE